MLYSELTCIEKEKIDQTIYILRQKSLGYGTIKKELEKQSIDLSRSTIRNRCKKIYALKGEKEPEADFKIDVEDELIYFLREKGLSYNEISRELKKQDIRIATTTVNERCKKIYANKQKQEPKPVFGPKKREPIDNELIYTFREKGLTYAKIVEEFKKYNIFVSYSYIRKICKSIYSSKGENEPKVKHKTSIIKAKKTKGPKKKDIDSELIYNLRKGGMSFKDIATEFKEKGISVSSPTISNRYKEICLLKGETIANCDNYQKNFEITSQKNNKDMKINILLERQKLDEEIYTLRQQGLSYKKIANKLKEKGITLSRQRVEQRYHRYIKYKI